MRWNLSSNTWLTITLSTALTILAIGVSLASPFHTMLPLEILSAVAALIFVYGFRQMAKVRPVEKLTALETEFKGFERNEIAAFRRVEEGKDVCRIDCLDRLVGLSFESTCERAARTIMGNRRLRGSLPKGLQHSSNLCTWLNILEHFQLNHRSVAERMYPGAESPETTVLNAPLASAVACQKIRDLLER